MKRSLVFFVAAAMLAMVAAVPVAVAQEATPTSGLEGLGLPELDVTVTLEGYEGIPDQIEAGRYLVTVTAPEEMEFGGGVAFVRPPEGTTTDAFLASIMGGPDETGVGEAAGTPIDDAASAAGTPAAEGEEGSGMPDALFQATYAGGVYADPGTSAQVVLDLGPGEWIAWADDPEAGIEPFVFQVTGEMPADLPEPEAGATIIMAEYLIEVSEGALAAGPQVVRIDNVGAQPHYIAWFLGPDGMTEEQIQIVLDEEMQAEMSGTPVAYSDLNPEEDLMPILFTATQSTGTSIWLTVDLPPGTHGLTCFFPDLGDGLPHAYHGMFMVVEVAE